MSFARWCDRIMFAALLLLALQLPILSDQYKQFLAGEIAVLTEQVNAMHALAREFGFPSVDDLLTHLQGNADPVVKTDTENKRMTIATLAKKQQAMEIMVKDILPYQVVHMVSPANHATLGKVIRHFEPGIPLDPVAIAYCALFAIVVDGILLLPFSLRSKRRAGYNTSFH